MSLLITEGARTILGRSAEVAASRHARQIEPADLLRAMVREESHASELLAAHGIGEHQLEERLQQAQPPLPADSTAADSADWRPESAREAGLFRQLLAAPSATSLPPLQLDTLVPASAALEDILAEARRQTGLAGRHAELGSRQLLLGLLLVASPISRLLQTCGMSPSGILEQTDGISGIDATPIDADFEINWQNSGNHDRTAALRTLDAAANRLREGLRVLEDGLRFCHDNAHLCGEVKACRHELQQILQPLEETWAIACRDTPGDVGTAISTTTELQRADTNQVQRAAMQRVLESLRTLEEFGKIISPRMAQQLEAMRYRCYTLDRALRTVTAARQRLAGCSLYLLVSGATDLQRLEGLVQAALAGGVDVVQLRDKQATDRELLQAGRAIREWTTSAERLFVMNDRPDLAVLTEADGVHVGQEELSVREARRIVGPHCFVGVSTHSLAQARQAVLDGADYLGVGPTFPSATKQFAEFPGLDNTRAVAADISLPWFAIGGITAANLAQVLAAGATRIAVSHAVCGAADPRLAARKLKAALRAATAD